MYEQLINENNSFSDYFKDNMICSVCLFSLNKENEVFLQCLNCNIYFHTDCYESDSLSTTKKKHLCDFCFHNKRIKEFKIPSCLLCPNKGGALKKIQFNKIEKEFWVHLLCANYTQELRLSKKVK